MIVIRSVSYIGAPERQGFSFIFIIKARTFLVFLLLRIELEV